MIEGIDETIGGKIKAEEVLMVVEEEEDEEEREEEEEEVIKERRETRNWKKRRSDFPRKVKSRKMKLKGALIKISSTICSSCIAL